MVALSGANSGAPRDNIINPDFDFGKLGIGGLGNEFNQIFRRAFASRVFPGHIVKQLGINHVRGMLLWGPPGCGKTLIARTIGKIFLHQLSSIFSYILSVVAMTATTCCNLFFS